jgi:two-component system, NtrC family, sensor histidine kinase HydH
LLKTSPAYLRWGLLISASITAAVLLAAGFWVDVGVGHAAGTVTQGQTIGVAFAARRMLRSAEEINSTVLHEILTDLAPQGLRYIEVHEAGQTLVAAAGTSAKDTQWSRPVSLGTAAAISLGPSAAKARMVIHSPEGSFAMANHPPAPPSPPLPNDHPLRGRRVVIEVDSSAALGLAWRGRITLIVALPAAFVILGLSAVFVRMSRHAEKASAQLEHDRQLKILGQMSAVLGHEIRNPLASLKGHAQLLLEKLPAEHNARKGAETVLRETIRLEELSRQVLAFARTGAVECEPTNPATVVRTAVENVGSSNVLLDIQAAPDVWPLDRARMEEVVVNLLRNARDASKPEQPINVTVGSGHEHGLVIEVRDHGEGIVAGEEERVFEPFYTRRAKGTGLGLALARRIVEGHGGAITAHNHPEGGAVFSVRLPPRTQGA